MSTEKLQEIMYLHSDGSLKTVAESLIVNLMNDENSTRSVAASLTQLISVSSTKQKGLELLNVCLPKCTPQIIAEYGLNWIRHCLNHREEDEQKELLLTTISNVVDSSQNQPDFKKKFVADYLSSTLDTALKPSSNLYVKRASLLCLNSCLSNYPNSCISFRSKIENYLTSCLIIPSDEIVSLSGSAYFHCQFTVSLRRITVTCHELYKSIFELVGQTEFERYEIQDETQPFDVLNQIPIHYSNHQKLDWMINTLKNCLKWLGVLLRKSATKTISVKEVLNLIHRGINMHVCLEQSHLSLLSSHYSLGLLLIQLETLKLLNVFICSMGRLLLPFNQIISRIFEIIMRRNQECSCYRNNLIIVHLYDVLSIWLKIVGDCFQKSFQHMLISSIIEDVFPVASSFVLKKNSSGHDNKKSFNSKQSSSEDCSNQIKITENGLNMLHILLSHTYLSVPKQVLTKLYNSVIKTVLEIQKGHAVFPYDSPEIQVILYKVLYSIFEQDSIGVLPPIHLVISLLLFGSKSKNLDIAVVCHKGLKILEKICQPVAPSLYLSNSNMFNNQMNGYEFNKVEDVENEQESSMDNIYQQNEQNNSIMILNNTKLVPENIIIQDKFSEDFIDYQNNDVITMTTQKLFQINEVVSENHGIKRDLSKIESNTKSQVEKSKSAVSKNVQVLDQGEPLAKKKNVTNNHESNMVLAFIDLVMDDYE